MENLNEKIDALYDDYIDKRKDYAEFFTQFYHLTLRPLVLFIVANRMQVSRNDVNDVAQEVYLSFHQTVRNNTSGFRPSMQWLRTVARNKIIDRWRHDKVETAPLLQHFFRSFMHPDLREHLAVLTERQAEIFLLNKVEGRTQEYIASIMGITPTTVAYEIRRAKELLRESILPKPKSKRAGGTEEK